MDIQLSIRSKTDGAVRQVNCAIGNGLVLGRGAEDGVLLDGPDLSREHLVLTTDGSEVYVTDLSSNGTWLNGTRLRKSIRSRVRPEDSMEVPGYVLTFRPASEPDKVQEVPAAQPAVAQPAPAVPEVRLPAAPPATPPPLPTPSGQLAMLDPVFRFVGSFTMMEKFLVFVGITGLLLLYTYVGT